MNQYEATILAICDAIAACNRTEHIGRVAYRALHGVDKEFALSLRNTSADTWVDYHNLPNLFLKIQEHYGES